LDAIVASRIPAPIKSALAIIDGLSRRGSRNHLGKPFSKSAKITEPALEVRR